MQIACNSSDVVPLCQCNSIFSSTVPFRLAQLGAITTLNVVSDSPLLAKLHLSFSLGISETPDYPSVPVTSSPMVEIPWEEFLHSERLEEGEEECEVIDELEIPSQELLWITNKHRACAAVEEAVFQWSYALGWASLHLTTHSRVHGSIVRILDWWNPRHLIQLDSNESCSCEPSPAVKSALCTVAWAMDYSCDGGAICDAEGGAWSVARRARSMDVGGRGSGQPEMHMSDQAMRRLE
ncbi:uncharacterized protein LOC122082047 [Macadamia integrifolia]|uniref:uncharacterized protein LOC122082047 n=1 Tax=Macadamia integrifolia TaxID=60698 RepID=UPI001C4ED1A5|nr:uncharacterized protein LOC122082047 [Macadamia integrifolia]